MKLCAGWLSTPIWDVLELTPRAYDRGLWEWSTCHVFYGGQRVAAKQRGFFIRRYEFDDYLLDGCGAEVLQGTPVKSITRDGDGFVVGDLRARYLVGAGGTHCPVARSLFPPKPRQPVGVQELEFQVEPGAVAATRLGLDGEPELLLHDDLRGYSWNVPKSNWLNVGCGTVNPREVRSAWQEARAFFQEHGHLPNQAVTELEKVKGHSYYLFDPSHLEACQRGNALLAGDALGLAQPLTAEGILPAVLSGRLAAEAILAGDPGRYPTAMASHPVFRDYSSFYYLREAGAAMKGRATPGSSRRGAFVAPLANAGKQTIANAFAWMFAGRPLPAGRLVSAAARGAYRLAMRQRLEQEKSRDVQ